MPSSISDKLAHFQVNDEVFTIHLDLLLDLVSEWPDLFEFTHDDENREPHYSYDCDDGPYVVRGLVYWIYTRDFPGDETIREWDYPEEWDEGEEEEPLACSLVIELYFFGWLMQIGRLLDEAMNFLFFQYKKQRIPPSVGRINQIYETQHTSGLKDFCVDMHTKWCIIDWSALGIDQLDDESGGYPTAFLWDFFVRMGMRNYKTAKDGSSAENCMVLKLRDYHEHWDKRMELLCPCGSPQEGIHFIIE